MGNFRYKRITDEEAKRLQRQYCEDNLFKLLMPVLEYYGKCCTELSPVEIWTEAMRLTCELVKSEHPEVKIKEVVGLLTNEYLSFSDCSERSMEDAERTAFLVLITLLFLLVTKITWQDEQMQHDIILRLAEAVYYHPLREDFMLLVYVGGDTNNAEYHYEKVLKRTSVFMASEPIDSEYVKVTLMQDFINSIKRHGDMETAKEIKGALSDFSRENGHLYDSALDDLSAWEEMKNNEPKGCKFFVQGNTSTDELKSADRTKSISLKSQTGGRRKAHLFMDVNGIKDQNITTHNVAAFTGFLAQHHSTSSVLLETKKDNYIAKVFVSFYRRWMNNGCVERTVNGSACYRFLTEDCGLPCATTEKTFSNWIKLKIKDDDADIILDGSIENYIRENNSYA
ncbi:hypothetical protein [Xylanibacter oryzae]|uniref:hypothetical protein n=1 Tax=Xylanibacter oryzae TaxID=185293 RepID=UPI0004AD78F8|nr:hypothetical protein [Xylanibacter oryzae]